MAAEEHIELSDVSAEALFTHLLHPQGVGRPLDRFDSAVFARMASKLPRVLQAHHISLSNGGDAMIDDLMSEWGSALRLSSYKYLQARSETARIAGHEGGKGLLSQIQAAFTTGLPIRVKVQIQVNLSVATETEVEIPEDVFLSNTHEPISELRFLAGEAVVPGYNIVQLRCAIRGRWGAICDAKDLSGYLCYCTDHGLQPILVADACHAGSAPTATKLYCGEGIPRAALLVSQSRLHVGSGELGDVFAPTAPGQVDGAGDPNALTNPDEMDDADFGVKEGEWVESTYDDVELEEADDDAEDCEVAFRLPPEVSPGERLIRTAPDGSGTYEIVVPPQGVPGSVLRHMLKIPRARVCRDFGPTPGVGISTEGSRSWGVAIGLYTRTPWDEADQKQRQRKKAMTPWVVTKGKNKATASWKLSAVWFRVRQVRSDGQPPTLFEMHIPVGSFTYPPPE